MTRPHASLHRRAMEALDKSDEAQRRGDFARAARFLREAFELEERAAERVAADLEPTRSILHRSAATIASRVGDGSAARRIVAAGLRGNPPSEIREELLELLEQGDAGSLLQAGEAKSGALVQQLSIRRSADRAGKVPLKSAMRVQGAWLELFNGQLPKEDPAWFPRYAMAGSYVVELEIKLTSKEVEAAFEALAEIGAPTKPKLRGKTAPKIAAKSLSKVRGLVSLLSALAEEGMDLSVVMRRADGYETRRAEVEIRSPDPDLILKLRESAAGLVASEDVPQADDLDRVFRFLEIVATGDYPTPDSLDVVPRQVNYYRRAAEILGVWRGGSLTAAGRVLLRVAPEDRNEKLLSALESSVVGSTWLEWSGEQSLVAVDPDSAETFLREASVGLAESTLKRRAKTLRRWLRALGSGG